MAIRKHYLKQPLQNPGKKHWPSNLFNLIVCHKIFFGHKTNFHYRIHQLEVAEELLRFINDHKIMITGLRNYLD